MKRWSISVVGLGLSVVALSACPGRNPEEDAGSDVVALDVRSDVSSQDVASDVPAADVVAQDAADVALTDVHTDTVPGDGGTPCTLRNVVVTTTDYVTGGFIIGDLATRTLRVVSPTAGPDGGAAAGVEQDHVVRTSGCIAFDLWRPFSTTRPNAVTTLNVADPYHPLRQIPLDPVPTGPDAGPQAANPYDIAVISPTRAYVTQYNSPEVVIVDPSRDGAAARLGTVDLRPLADADGIPEATAIAIVGNRAYVTLQQLNRAAGYSAPAHSHVAVIDTTTDRLVDVDTATDGTQGIELSFGNPGGRIAVSLDGARLLVSSGGDYGATPDGGIDVIAVATNSIERSLTGAMLSGEPNGVEVVDATTAWVALEHSVADAGSVYRIVRYNFVAGEVMAGNVVQSTTVVFGGLRRAPDGSMWAIDTGYAGHGSVHAFRADGTPLLAAPFDAPAEVHTYSLDFAP